MLDIHIYKEVLQQVVNSVTKVDVLIAEATNKIDKLIDTYLEQEQELTFSLMEAYIQSEVINYPVKSSESHVFIFAMKYLKELRIRRERALGITQGWYPKEKI